MLQDCLAPIGTTYLLTGQEKRIKKHKNQPFPGRHSRYQAGCQIIISLSMKKRFSFPFVTFRSSAFGSIKHWLFLIYSNYQDPLPDLISSSRGGRDSVADLRLAHLTCNTLPWGLSGNSNT